MGFLDGGFLGLGGGSKPSSIQTQTTSSAPWASQQPYLQEIFTGAQNAYNSGVPNYYPENTVVDFSPQTQAGLNAIEQRAAAGSPVQQQAMQQAGNVLSGQYMGASPFLSGAYQQAMQPVMDQWQNQIAPGIDAQFINAGAGGMRSGAYANARNTAEDTLGRAMTGTAADMAYKDYSNERGYMQQMIGAAPALAQSDYGDMTQMMNVGAARDTQEGARLQDQITRYNFEQNKPWQNLAQYSGIVGGGYGQEKTQATPMYTNPAANFLGGALGGAQIGSLTPMGGGYGAIAGGLLGALG